VSHRSAINGFPLPAQAFFGASRVLAHGVSPFLLRTSAQRSRGQGGCALGFTGPIFHLRARVHAGNHASQSAHAWSETGTPTRGGGRVEMPAGSEIVPVLHIERNLQNWRATVGLAADPAKLRAVHIDRRGFVAGRGGGGRWVLARRGGRGPRPQSIAEIEASAGLRQHHFTPPPSTPIAGIRGSLARRRNRRARAIGSVNGHGTSTPAVRRGGGKLPWREILAARLPQIPTPHKSQWVTPGRCAAVERSGNSGAATRPSCTSAQHLPSPEVF